MERAAVALGNVLGPVAQHYLDEGARRRRFIAESLIASDYRLFAHPCCRTIPRSALLGAQKLGPNTDLGSASP